MGMISRQARWIAVAGLLVLQSPAKHGRALNPDGSAWVPSLSARAHYRFRRVIQKAHLTPDAELLMVSEARGYYDLSVMLPLSRALSLGGAFSSGEGMTETTLYAPGFAMSSKIMDYWSGYGMSLHIYSQGFFPARETRWGEGRPGGPDGLYWHPNLRLHYGTSSVSLTEERMVNGTALRGQDLEEDSFESLKLSLPMPGDWLAYLYHAASLTGSGSWTWEGGIARYLDRANKPAEERSWNPDGREDALRFGLNYGQSRTVDNRMSSQLAGASLAWILNGYSTLTFGASLLFFGEDSDPYKSSGTIKVETKEASRQSLSAHVGLKLYLPGTIPERP